jgi:hypothetical protein
MPSPFARLRRFLRHKLGRRKSNNGDKADPPAVGGHPTLHVVATRRRGPALPVPRRVPAPIKVRPAEPATVVYARKTSRHHSDRRLHVVKLGYASTHDQPLFEVEIKEKQ